MFLRSAWYAAGWSKDFDECPAAISLLAEGLVVYRNDAGTAVVMEDRCPHRFAALSLGRREGDALRCMYHGLLFGPDGACRYVPGQPVVPRTLRVRTYPTVDRHSVLWVWMEIL